MTKGFDLQSRFVVACLAIAGALAALLGRETHAGVNQWTYHGPAGGTLVRLLASPSNDAVLYAATERAVHKSIDGGATWRALRPFSSIVRDLAVSPLDADLIFVSTEGEGIFRSVDGGDTFVPVVPATEYASALAIGSNAVYYTNGFGLYRSLDNGQTWALRAASSAGYGGRLFVDIVNPNVLHSFGGYWYMRSTDGGVTWATTQVSADRFVTDLVQASDSSLVAVADDGIHISTDGGANWTRRLQCDCRAVAADPNVPTTMLASSSRYLPSAVLYRSTDGGLSWSTFVATPNHAAEAIVIGRQPPSPILIANSSGVFRSTDNGSSWAEADPGPVGAAVIQLAPSTGSAPRMYAFSGGSLGYANGLFALEAGTWRRLNLVGAEMAAGGLRFSSVTLRSKPGASNTLFIGATNEAVVRSMDGGNSWTAVRAPFSSVNLTSFEFEASNPNVVHVAGYRTIFNPGPPPSLNHLGSIFRSSDNGATWNAASWNLPSSFVAKRLIKDPTNASRQYAVGFPTGFARSLDNGASWSVSLLGEALNDVEIDPSDGRFVYATGNQGVSISEDGGATFLLNSGLAQVASRRPVALAVDPGVPDTLYAVSEAWSDITARLYTSSGVYRSVDKGRTWEVLRAESTTPTWAANDIALDPTNPSILHVATGYRGIATLELAQDLAAIISGHSGAKAFGAPATFAIRVQNFGPQAATRVRVQTTLPPSIATVTGTALTSGTPAARPCTFLAGILTCEIGLLRSGATATIAASYVAPQAMAVPITTIVSAQERDTLPGNNAHSATAMAVEVVDLKSTIAAAANAVNIGEALGYSVTVANEGPSPASSAILTLSVPVGTTLTVPAGCAVAASTATCTVGSLAVGAIQTFAFAMASTNSGPITVQASVVPATGVPDPDLSDNSAIATTLVRPESDLSITIADSADPIVAGNIFDYRINIRNEGLQAMPNVVAALVRTGGIASTVTATHGGCASSKRGAKQAKSKVGEVETSGVDCNLGSLEPGMTAQVVLTVSTGGMGTVSLDASVASDGNDRVTSNNAARETTEVRPQPPPEKGGGAASVSCLLLLAGLAALRHCTRRRLLAWATGWLLTLSAYAGPNSWTFTGPAGGQVVQVVSSPSNENIVYAAFARTLHKSSDGGATWETVAHFDTELRGIAVDPAASETLYIVAPGRGLYRSDDGGKTTQLVGPTGIAAVGVGGNAIVYRSASDRSFHRSTDQGLTWSLRSTTQFEIGRIYVDFGNPLLVFGVGNGRLHRSMDGGVTWTQLNVPPPVNQLARLSSSTLVATVSGGIYVSNDDGATWTLRAGAYSIPVAAHSQWPGVVVAGYGFGLYRSTDYGATWSNMAIPPNVQVYGLALHRQSGRIVVVGDRGVFSTPLNGGPWVESSPGPAASTVSRLIAGSGGSPRVYALRNAELLYATRDSEWQRIPLPLAPPNNFTFPAAALGLRDNDPNYLVLGGGVQSGILISSDAGATWSQGTSPEGAIIGSIAVHPTNPNVLHAHASNVYVSPTVEGVYTSEDRGATWTRRLSLTPQEFGTTLAIDPSNPARLYLAAKHRFSSHDDAGLYWSADGGASWNRRFAGTSVGDVVVHPTDGRVFAMLWNGLHISTDGGATFNADTQFGVMTNYAASAVAIDPVIPSVLYAASSGWFNLNTLIAKRPSYLLRSVDNGLTWETLHSEQQQPNLQIERLALDPLTPSIVYAGTDGRGVGSFEVAPDMAVTISGHVGERAVGEVSSFDLRVDNLGPFAANAVRLAASMPTGATIESVTTNRGSCSISTTTTVGCMLGLMRAGISASVQVTYRVTAATALPVVATISAHERDFEPANSTAQSLAYSGEVADLRATLTASPATVNTGDTVTYSVLIHNEGPTATSDAVVTISPSANQTIAVLPVGCSPAGTSIVCNIAALGTLGVSGFSVRTIAQSIGTASLGVSVVPSATAVDPDSPNNTARVEVQVRPRGDLSVTVEDNADPVMVGAEFEYTVNVRNAGPDGLPNVAANLEQVGGSMLRVSTTRGSCVATVCNLGSLGAGEEASLTVVASASAAGTTSLRAIVASNGGDDRRVINDSDREVTTVNAPAPTSGGSGRLDLGLVFILACCALLRVGTNGARRPR